jgi:predicted Zn-dependent protease
MRNRSLTLAATLCAAVVVASALSAAEPEVVVPPYNRMSDADEVALGREAAAGIEKEQKLTFVDAPALQAYVQNMVTRIARVSRRPQLTYTVKVVDTPEVNASALPGGFLYVNRGLIEWAQSESELAAVLSHEVGHVVGRHGANNVARATAVDSILSEFSTALLGTNTPAKIVQQVGGPLAFLALLQYSRSDELQADLLGYYNLQRAGWHPDGMVALFRHLGQGAGQSNMLMAFTSSHPAPADREAQITREMRGQTPDARLVRDAPAFKQWQDQLKRMPRKAAAR